LENIYRRKVSCTLLLTSNLVAVTILHTTLHKRCTGRFTAVGGDALNNPQIVSAEKSWNFLLYLKSPFVSAYLYASLMNFLCRVAAQLEDVAGDKKN